MSLEKSILLGSVWQILARTPRASFSLAAIDYQIAAPIGLKQIEILHSDLGEPLGYIVWAFCTERVLGHIHADESKILHVSEWNEGDICVVLDVVSTSGGIRPLLRRFLARVAKTHSAISYVRTTRGRRVLRHLTLRDQHTVGIES